MKKAFARFLISIFILLLIFAPWMIFEAQRALFNPDARAVSEISDSAIVIVKDRGAICFFVDEQTRKVRARITAFPPVRISYRNIYQSASCKLIGNEVICSVLAVYSVKNEPNYLQSLFPAAGESIDTGPISLQEGDYDVYIGENYQGRMIVTIGENVNDYQCKSPLGTLMFSIPPTQTSVR